MVACSTARWNAGLEPIIFGAPPTSSRRRSFSARRLACSSAFLSASSTLSRLSGFSRKSKAPARVASTASAMVPWPEIMMAGAGLPFCRTERSRSMPLPSGSRTSNRNASARSASGMRAELGAWTGRRDTVALALQNHAQRAADILFVIHDQNAFGCHWTPRAAARGKLRRPVLLSPADVAARQQRALARDRKPQPHAALLERNGGLKQRLPRLLAQARAGIVHFDQRVAVAHRGDAQDPCRPSPAASAAFSSRLVRMPLTRSSSASAWDGCRPGARRSPPRDGRSSGTRRALPAAR